MALKLVSVTKQPRARAVGEFDMKALHLSGLVTLAFVAAACTSVDVPDRAPLAEPLHLVWYEWHGESWGADFMRTDLAACEIDFERREWRRIALAVQRPDEMLPCPGEELPWQLTSVPFEPIDEVLFAKLLEATRAWLATEPRPTDDSARLRGRESGYLERFTLTTDRGEFRVRVNPPDGVGDEPRPRVNLSYPAYRELRALLVPLAFDG